MMTTQLRNLLTAVVCLLGIVSAQAQFTGSATQYPTTGYEASPISFKLSDVAAALDTDAATLGAALAEYIEAEEVATPLFFVQQPDGTESSAPTADANGFWLSPDGANMGYVWGEKSFYASPDVDVEADAFAFYCGQMPNVMEAGDEAHATIKLKYNSKEVSFTISLSVIAKPVYEVPEPTVIENALTIVGGKETIVEQFPRGDYSSDAVQVEVSEALNLLGISDGGLLEDAIDKVLYTTWYNDGDVEQGGGMKKDSLTNSPTGEGHGFWYRAVQNAEGEEDGEVAAAGWGGTDKFYMNSFTYTAADGLLTCQLGQYPGVCKDNEQWFAYVYIIYGDKAYRVKYTLKLQEKEQGSGLDGYTKMGETTVVVEQEPAKGWSSSQVKADVDAIAAALGCDVSALGIAALDDKDNFAGSTANNGGYWFNDAGLVVAYPGTFYIEPAASGNYSTFNVGQLPNNFNIGDEVSANIYFMNGTNYYTYTVDLKIVEPQKVEHNFESVATRVVNVQGLPANAYPIEGPSYRITEEDVQAILGTSLSDAVLYGWLPDSVAATTGSNYTKDYGAYGCDPKPGFWLSADGDVCGYGGGGKIGLCIGNGGNLEAGLFDWYQMPGQMSIGDVYKTQLFLVNEETNKMITFNITINFVESLQTKEVVGSENITIVVNDAVENTETAIDLAKPAEALGVTVDDLMNVNNYYLRGLTSGGVYGEGQNVDNGLSFGLDGGYDGYGDLYFWLEAQGSDIVLCMGSNAEIADDYNVDAQFCFEVDNKQYVYFAKFVSEKVYSEGITDVKVGQRSRLVYDLSGRRVVKPVSGLYIVGGKKLIVK